MINFFMLIVFAIQGNEQPLHDYLLSKKRPLKKLERKWLADYFTGLKRGRPRKFKVPANIQRKAALEFIERRNTSKSIKKTASDIYAPLYIERSTFYKWVKEIEYNLSKLSEQQRASFIKSIKKAEDGSPNTQSLSEYIRQLLQGR